MKEDEKNENIDEPVVIRHRDGRVVTIYVPRCSPEAVEILKADLLPRAPVFLEVRFKVGVFSYLWNKLMYWALGG